MNTVLTTPRHRCSVSRRAVLPGRNGVEMGAANSLHAYQRVAASIMKDLIVFTSEKEIEKTGAKNG